MLYREWLPHPYLRPWVRCYWSLEDPRPGGDETIFPDGCFEIVLHRGGGTAHAGAAGGVVAQPRAILIGEIQRPVRLLSPDGVGCFGVRFRAGGIAPFLDVPVGELVHGIHALFDVLPEASELPDRLFEAAASQRAGILDRFLLHRLAARDHATTARLLALLHRGMNDSVGELARRTGMSMRQLQRRMRAILGIPPKRMMRILRFQGALQALLAGDADRALDAYYDQAHLLRDFRDFAATTPSQIAGRELDLNRHFHHRDLRRRAER